jgi:uncharacterized membrane protein
MIWYVLLGISTGMRTMTATAVLCWFAWLRLLPQDGWAFWAANLVSVIVFTLLALGEYVGDTLPSTPSRTQLPLVLARLAFASLAGALVAHATAEPLAGGILFAAVGSLIGTYGGYHLRMFGARRVGRDLPVALSESALALGIALYVAVRLHKDLVSPTVQNLLAGRFHA